MNGMKDFQDFLNNFGVGEEVAEQNHRVAFDRFQAASVIAAPFMLPEGRLALSELRARTIEHPAFVPGETEGYGYMREGQNSIVRFIETCIRVAEQGPPAAGVPEPVPQTKGRKRNG